MKKLKKLPKFKNEDEERDFWATHDSTDYFPPGGPVVFPNLKPSTEKISIRLPIALLGKIKSQADKMDVAYQALIKVYLDAVVNGGYVLAKPERQHKKAV